MSGSFCVKSRKKRKIERYFLSGICSSWVISSLFTKKIEICKKTYNSEHPDNVSFFSYFFDFFFHLGLAQWDPQILPRRNLEEILQQSFPSRQILEKDDFRLNTHKITHM